MAEWFGKSEIISDLQIQPTAATFTELTHQVLRRDDNSPICGWYLDGRHRAAQAPTAVPPR